MEPEPDSSSMDTDMNVGLPEVDGPEMAWAREVNKV